ncbi:MAG: HTH domain-containing protein, partial [Gammaproteobacteria bacterium]
MAIENLIETLKILSDGNSYSGEEIGKRLGIGRAAIWKIISQLREKGLQIESVKGQGYKLLDNVEMLDENTIKADLKDNSFDEIITLNQTASTNSYLSSQFTDSTKNLACIAENQTGGRGRNNRSWISPFARSIAMSVRWH